MPSIFKNLLLISLFVSINLISKAQSLALDPTFQLPPPVKSALVNDMQVQSDGKIIVCGSIHFFGDEQVANIIRLNEDGSLDQSFVSTEFKDRVVEEVELMANGSIVIRTALGIAILSSSGDKLYGIDTLFANEEGHNRAVSSVEVQPDNKILVSSWFYNPSVPTFTDGFVQRFNVDLTPDETFVESTFNGMVNDIALQGEQIIIIGNFTEIDGNPQNHVARLDKNGNHDNSFNTGPGFERTFILDISKKIMVQPDQKVLINLDHVSFNGFPQVSLNKPGDLGGGFIRLNQDGTVDTAFHLALKYSVYEAIISGSYLYTCGQPHLYSPVSLSRFNLNDGAFVEEIQLINEYEYGAISSNNKGDIYLVGRSEDVDGGGISKYNTDDLTFTDFAHELGQAGDINAVEYQNDQLLLKGRFYRLGDHKTEDVAIVDTDGNVQRDFITADHENYYLDKIHWNADGSFLIKYRYASPLYKYDKKGEQIPTFNVEEVYSFEVLPDERIMVAFQDEIAIIHSDGTLDGSFTPISFAANTNMKMTVQSNGVLVSGAGGHNENTVFSNLFLVGLDGTIHDIYTEVDFIHQEDDIDVNDEDEIFITGNYQILKIDKDGKKATEFNENVASSLPDNFHPRSGQVYLNGLLVSGNNHTHKSENLILVDSTGTVVPTFKLPEEVHKALTPLRITSILPVSILPVILKDSSIIAFADFTLAGESQTSYALKFKVSMPDDISSALQVKNLPNVQLYPNPTSDFVKIQKCPTEVGRVIIRDLQGKKLFEKDAYSLEEISVQNLQPGVYIVTIGGFDWSQSFKLIKK